MFASSPPLAPSAGNSRSSFSFPKGRTIGDQDVQSWRLSRVFKSLLSLVLLSMSAALCPAALCSAAQDLNHDDFESASQVLLRRCVECHRDGNESGGLRLDEATGLAAGGDSGPAISADEPLSSELLRRIDDAEMPPPEKGHARPLPESERNAIAAWIDSGAHWPSGRKLDPFEVTTDVRGGRDWWSWQPLTDTVSPQSSLSDQRNYIDAFVDERLALAGLAPAPEASRDELIRRLTYDITGLPVSSEERERFLADSRPDAYERAVDRLLSSPRFGERWARQWMDVVRYADTSGYERDQEKPYAWKYRDWVIDAMNDDLPFSQFVIDQLAGDERPDANEQSVIATGMLRLGTWNDEPNDPEDYQYERLEDLVHVTFSAFMGLTVKCARCHDHKFDPIPQVDYYRVAAAFWAGPVRPDSREHLGGPTEEQLGYAEVLGWTDVGREPPALHRLAAGDASRPMEVVEPGFLSLLEELDQPLASPPQESRTTHRRLQLARWLVDSRNTLTYRVFVNRLWLGHFGAGIVRSTNNWGYTGDLPTHPELLDRLALDLQSLGDVGPKLLHRRMVLSAAYRRSAEHPSAELLASRDANNRLLWRAERRRRDAESIRDALLFATDQLDYSMRGPGFRPTLSPEALEGLSRRSAAWSASSLDQQRRRAVYEYSSRSLIDPLLTTFDFPDTTLPCGERDQSIVAPQALTMLNDPQLDRWAQTAVDALLVAVDSPESLTAEQEQALIDRLFVQILAREPQAFERDAAWQHLEAVRREFNSQATTAGATETHAADEAKPEDEWPEGLVLALLADEGVIVDEHSGIERWEDQSSHEHHATQTDPTRRPKLISHEGRPAVAWDAARQLMNLEGSILGRDDCTIIAVVSDQGGEGLREVISNWNGAAGNSTSSLFLGLSGEQTIRFSDDLSVAASIEPNRNHILLASNGSSGSIVRLDGQTPASREQRLAARRLDTPWVIGTQGNIDGEYWNGTISAVVVFDRPLETSEADRVAQKLADRFNGQWQEPEVPIARTPLQRAWESLVIVLLNTNEFLYVD